VLPITTAHANQALQNNAMSTASTREVDDNATVVDAVNMVRSTSEHNGEERGYHHGNLREALVEAGVDLARTGGPNAVLLRAASRQAGVSHNAVYRHFANQEDLLAAVAERCMTQLGLLMIERSTRVTARGPVPRARARLEAIGRAYIDFARTEPGWFRTAFSSPAPRRGPTRAPADRAVPSAGLSGPDLLRPRPHLPSCRPRSPANRMSSTPGSPPRPLPHSPTTTTPLRRSPPWTTNPRT